MQVPYAWGMIWFYLALLATLLYAIVNLLDDNLLHYVYKGPYIATGVAGVFGMLPLVSLFFLDATSITTKLALISIITGLLTTSYLFFYFRGLDSDSPAVVVALLGLSPATLPILAHYILNENLSVAQLTGFVIVLVASLLIAMPNVKELKFSKALVPALIAVVFIDVFSITSKYVYDRTDFYSAYMFLCLGMGIGGLFFLALGHNRDKKAIGEIKKKLAKLLPIFIGAELLALSAEFTLNLAVSKGSVSLVKVIGGVQPMFVLIIALLLFPFWPKFFREASEGHLIRKFALMIVIVAGLALIAVSSA